MICARKVELRKQMLLCRHLHLLVSMSVIKSIQFTDDAKNISIFIGFDHNYRILSHFDTRKMIPYS